MIEHPVPQNITEYQFHLIGNMTIKQFLVLLGGVGLAFIFYSTNLPGIIQWPLVMIAVGGAAALAFVPYEERTLDQWLINFIRAIYRPTKYYWRRTAPTPEYFAYTSTSDLRKNTSIQSSVLPQKNRQVAAYISSLQSTHPTNTVADPLDLFGGQSDSVTSLFETVSAAVSVTPGNTPTIEKPDLQVRTRPLGSMRGMVFSTTAQKTEVQSPNQTDSRPTFSPTDFTSAPAYTMEAESNTGDSAPNNKNPNVAPTAPKGFSQTTQLETVHLSNDAAPAAPEPIASDSVPQINTQTSTQANNQADTYTTKTEKISSERQTIPAIFNAELPFPSLPDKPNILFGMVRTSDKNIIPGAIVEVLDTAGNTVRAMKTNTLGQFYISTPLQNGQYHIEIDADTHIFPVYSLELTGNVLQPIDLIAHS